MKILIIKTSSLGDIVHTLPALTDAKQAIPHIQFDWVVEESFAPIPTWHPFVNRVIPVALRKWRKNPLRYLLDGSIYRFLKNLRTESYDMIIDAQGLIKSAVITRLAHGFRVGLDKKSLTEPLARFAYQKKVTVDLSEQAVFRMRSVFAKALGYEMPDTKPDFGISQKKSIQNKKSKTILFVHGTTWPSKHWPDNHWIALAKLASQKGFTVKLPWYNEVELERVKKISEACPKVHILPKMSLDEIKAIMEQSWGVVGVDTGLSHIAAALNIPTIVLYGPSSPGRTGAVGEKVIHLTPNFPCTYCDKEKCYYEKKYHENAVCMTQLTPDKIISTICSVLSQNFISLV
ncbi:MAG: lipopolysaccharide heptosyltransferase I [Gammaproteobacteria bacterium]|nr:lipopolysaccharide heptosyltransferase I [Gammaproteobacteria bacterium]